MRPEVDLQTPWLRDELISRLDQLAGLRWMEGATSSERTALLDQILDFLDDTGVLDEPGERIGHILFNQPEADAMTALGIALERVLGPCTDRDWNSVGIAAREALQVLMRSK